MDDLRLDAIKRVFDKASDFDDAAKRLLILGSTWKPVAQAKLLTSAFELTALSGRDAVVREMDGEDETDAFADPQVINQPFKEQIDFFRQKSPRPTKGWNDLTRGDHDRAFVVAGAKDLAMLQDFQNAIGKAIKDGTTLETFRKDFDEIVARYGWSYKGSRAWRTKIIFETNIRTSYMAGRLKQMRDPAVIKARPYWQYRHGVTRKPKIPRRQHLAWDGLILPHDDAFWQIHFPPNDWQCSCGVRTLSHRDLQRLGKTGPDTAPEILMEPQLDKATGKLIELPQGIGQGWDYQPGNLWERGLTPSLIERPGGKLAFGVDDVMAMSDLVSAGKPFAHKELPSGKPAEFYVKKFLSVFGMGLGKSKLFKDKAGDQILISDELFKDARGNYKTLKRGREVHAAQLAETIADPDEIWIGVAQRMIPDDQGGGSERVLDRRYIRVDPKTGLLAIFELYQDRWTGKTAFRPMKKKSIKTDVNQIDRRRGGKLLYQRGK